ncbi:uncharacterized protein LOC114261262 [Camellia sinensis]|uniref:uncharacterized protein LOC114261262 n=1 Tax=Camellia sinensis TaxID=4442 RepID=UPI001035AF50|nr:uncharacterized protein LOC114261262 [Camellia sinensis]
MSRDVIFVEEEAWNWNQDEVVKDAEFILEDETSKALVEITREDEPQTPPHRIPALRSPVSHRSAASSSSSALASSDDSFFKQPRPMRNLQEIYEATEEADLNLFCQLVDSPYHHGKDDLQLVENVKPMPATLFLQDSGKTMDEVYSIILEKVVDDARSCYVKRSTNKYNREQFATMILLDGCFILAIIEDFFPYVDNQKSKYDDVRDHLGLLFWFSTFDHIFYLLENQLPFQVLELLMSLKFKEDEGMESINKLLNFFDFYGL